MKWIVSLCGVGAFLSVVGVASAVPAPLSPEELETGAELIVDAEVTKVSCLGQQTVPGVGTTTTYRSTFEILNLYKGTDPDPLQISFEISDGDPGLCAWAEPPHPVGQRAKLWLNAMGDGSYGMISWNAMEELSDSDPQPLDACGLPGFDDAESGDDEDSGEVADAGTEPEDAGPVVDDISEETDTGSELSDARGTDDAESGAPDAGMSAADAMPESSDADGEAGAQSDAQSAAGDTATGSDPPGAVATPEDPEEPSEDDEGCTLSKGTQPLLAGLLLVLFVGLRIGRRKQCAGAL